MGRIGDIPPASPVHQPPDSRPAQPGQHQPFIPRLPRPCLSPGLSENWRRKYGFGEQFAMILNGRTDFVHFISPLVMDLWLLFSLWDCTAPSGCKLSHLKCTGVIVYPLFIWLGSYRSLHFTMTRNDPGATPVCSECLSCFLAETKWFNP